jgi:hypothetical protein
MRNEAPPGEGSPRGAYLFDYIVFISGKGWHTKENGGRLSWVQNTFLLQEA